DLAGQFPPAKGWFDRAHQILGCDLAAVCFNGPETELTRTENAQPGIFVVSWIALELLKERVPGCAFQRRAGFSLGELTADAAGQIGISGQTEKVGHACDLAKGQGAKRVLPLAVAGAYHARLMAGAGPKVKSMLESVAMHDAGVPVISNVTAQPHGNITEIQ